MAGFSRGSIYEQSVFEKKADALENVTKHTEPGGKQDSVPDAFFIVGLKNTMHNSLGYPNPEYQRTQLSEWHPPG